MNFSEQPVRDGSDASRQTARWKTYLVYAVTLSRLLLTPFVVWSILNQRPLLAGFLCAIAGATDGIDGSLARRFRATTRAGQYLDPISDKVLLSAVYVALAWIGSVPGALVLLIFGRDLALLTASAIAMRWTSYNNYRPTIWGKLSTLVQIMTAVVVLAADAWGGGWLRELARGLMVATAVATCWSAVHYTWRGVAYFRHGPNIVDGGIERE